MIRPRSRARPDPARTLTKALLRAAERLGASRALLSDMLGVSAATLSRVVAGRDVDPESKTGELALLFLRVFRSLDALLGGNADQCRAWFHARNDHLGGIPADLVRSARGLVRVADYLDAMRGRI